MWKLKHGQMWVGMWLWMAPLARTAGAGADESCEGLTDLDSPENGGGACTTDVDCWINGDCGATGCRCDTGWTGPHCELLDLLPAQDPEIGSYVAPDGTSSWGMSVARDPKGGKYHGYVSEFAHGCKLGSWTSNSYINHIVSDTPTGPWKQGGVAVPVWAHNPRVLLSPTDGKWLLYGIMGGARRPTDCGGARHPPGQPGGADALRAKVPQHAAGTAFPFAIQHADGPDGPWRPVDGRRPKQSSLPTMTLHRNVDNVDVGGAGEYAAGSGVRLHRIGEGAGTVFVPASSFRPMRRSVGGGRTLAVFGWDACGEEAPTFGDGGPIWSEEDGMQIGGFEVVGDPSFAVEVAVECAITFDYPSGVKLTKVTTADGFQGTAPGFVPRDHPRSCRDRRVLVKTTSVPWSARGVPPLSEHVHRYMQIAVSKKSRPAKSHLSGQTQDAEGCRGVCESMRSPRGMWDQACTSYTWRGHEGGNCYTRSDLHWNPVEVDAGLDVASGRPWHPQSGDNPAPWIDPATGNVTVLWRVYSEGGSGPSQESLCGQKSMACGASLIGASVAPSWRGPYTEVRGPDQGPISALQYPEEENEDPFLWKTKRGWHAILHSNTWSNSRSEHFPTAQWAGRYGYSLDGVRWHYSPVAPFTGTVRWTNGSSSEFDRRERPFLLFNERGAPTHLYTGVQRYSHDEYTFSLIQPVARGRSMNT